MLGPSIGPVCLGSEAGGVLRLSKRAFVAVDTTISTRPLTRERVKDKGITRNNCILASHLDKVITLHCA